MSADKPPGSEDPKSSPDAASQDSQKSSLDLYQDSQVQLDPTLRAKMRDAAKEVSQGRFRERAYSPRQKLSAQEISGGLRGALKLAVLNTPTGADAEQPRREVKAAWLPFVQQAVEQAGGDGLDAHVWALLGKKKVPARDALLAELLRGFAVMNHAQTLDAFLGEAGKVESIIEHALAAPALRPLSYRAVEKDLEGRLDLDSVLALLFSTEAELELRLDEVKASIENIRSQLKELSGQPNALLWNFARFKVERLLIEAEQKRRRAAPEAPTGG